MFIPQSGYELFDNVPEAPNSDEEQQFLLRNHLTIAVSIIEDGQRTRRAPMAVLHAIKEILEILYDYLQEQRDTRPWSWATQRGFPHTIHTLLVSVTSACEHPADQQRTYLAALLGRLKAVRRST